MKNPKSIFVLIVSVIALTIFSTAVSAEPVVTESWAQHAAGGFAGGSGTESDPYQIATAEQLAYLSSVAPSNRNYLSSHYVLTENITISAHNWVPIDSEFYDFSGSFDGGGNTITGLTIKDIEGSTPVGLFSSLTSGAVIKNLKFSNVDIDVSSESVGTLAGKVEYLDRPVTVYNVEVLSGSVRSDKAIPQVSKDVGIGGIIGGARSDLYINRCFNAATVSATVTKGVDESQLIYNVGGIIGGSYSSIQDCINVGDVSVTNTLKDNVYISINVGGITGIGSTIANSSNSGSITINDNSVRGEEYVDLLMGGISNNAMVSNSYNDGTITYSGVTVEDRGAYFGGISGGLGDSGLQIINCVNTGEYITSIDSELDDRVKFFAISYIPTHNSYWTDKISGGNRPAYSVQNIVEQSGSFDAEGNITKPSYSSGALLGNTLNTALNQWVSDKGTKDNLMYINWEVNGDEVAHVSPKDVAVTITDENGMVDGATIKLYTEQGHHIETATTVNGVVTLKNISDGRYRIDVSAEGRLTLSTLLENNGALSKSFKLINLSQPTLLNGEVLVDSIGDLAYVSQQVNSGADSYEDKTIKLTDNISLLGYDWTPIGFLNPYDKVTYKTLRPFKGIFDGNGKTISDITVKSLINPIGLFGYIENGTVSNLTLDGVSLSGYSLAAGAVVGVSVNTDAKNPVEINGIIVNNANITSSFGNSSLYNDLPDSYLGGIAGKFIGGIMEDCTVNSGSISNLNDHNSAVGGMIGVVREMWQYATPYGSNMTIQLNNLTNKAEVTSNNIAAGIIGLFNPADNTLENSINHSTNHGTITGVSSVGGIAGWAEYMAGDINFCTNNGNIIGSDSANLSTSSAIGIGGIVGNQRSPNTSINGCVNNAVVHAKTLQSFNVGGITGYISDGSVINNTNNGDVTGLVTLSNITAGGIAGRISGESEIINIINNSNTARISIDQNGKTGDVSVGGIAGHASGRNSSRIMNLNNNYNYGTMGVSNTTDSGENYVGTLIGRIINFVSISNNYAIAQSIVDFIDAAEPDWGDVYITLSGNATFTSANSSLTALTGTIPGFADGVYTGALLDDELLKALYIYVNDSTHNPNGELYGWKVVSGQNNGYPILDIPIPPNYDANGDGDVDVEDIKFVLKSENYNKPVADAANPEADLNKDGYINFLDIAGARNFKNFNAG